MTHVRTVISLGMLAVLLIGLAFTPAAPTSAQTEAPARVRVIHASPNAPNVDVFVGADRVLTNVPFFTTSAYLDVPAGERQIRVSVTGRPASEAVIDATVTLAAGQAYSVIARGLVANIEATVTNDDLSRAEGNQAKVRVYHLSPDAPAVAIQVRDGTTLTPLITDLAFPNASDYLNVPPGTYDLVVTPSGSDDVVLELPDTVLEAGKIYDVFAIRQLASIEAAVRVTDASARVRAIHASPDAPNVDVYVDNTRVLVNVPFFTVSDYLDVPAGNRRLRVIPTGQPTSAAVIDATVPIETGRVYSVAAVGQVAQIRAQIIQENLSAPTPGNAKVRVYHFSPNAPAVAVKARTGNTLTTLIPNLAFPNATPNYLDVPAGTYNLVVTPATPANSTQVVLDLPNTVLEAGKIYDVFATNLLANITAEVRVISAKVRVVHAAPDAPEVDVYVNGSAVLEDVPFLTVSNYLHLPQGEYDIAITQAGRPLSQAVLRGNVPIDAGRSYTLAAVGTLDTDDAAEFDLVQIVDDLSAPAAGRAKVAVYHFSPDAPAVAVKARTGTTFNTLIPSIAFPNASDYLSVPAGVYNLVVTPATPANSTQVVIDLPNTRFSAGRIYSVFAFDVLADIQASVVVTGPDGVPVTDLFLPTINRNSVPRAQQ